MRGYHGAMLRRTFSRPLPLLLLVVGLFTVLIQSGELGTSDTTDRLQVTHWLWTDSPQIYPDQLPEAGLPGRGGKLYAHWGIGHSLLLLPSDLLGTALSHLAVWHNYVDSQQDPAIRSIVASVTTNILVNVLTAWLTFSFLQELGFSLLEAVAGVLALLLATTHLHYAQNMSENNFLFLLTLAALAFQYHWLRTGQRRALFWGGVALGWGLITRMTTVLDLLACCTFVLFAAWLGRGSEPRGAPRLDWPSLRTWLLTVGPVLGFAVFLDRLYQWIRFGSWTSTYLAGWAAEQRRYYPSLPVNYPYNGHFFKEGVESGVIGPFLSPEKSILLFDPVFVVTLVLVLLLWKRLPSQLKAFQLSAYILVGIYILFYARFPWWSGDFAWGDRYISSTVELAAMLGIPLLMRHWRALAPAVRWCAVAFTALSVAIQCASLAFWLPLEIYQGQDFRTAHGGHTFVIGLRFENILAFVLGKHAAWGLNTPAMFQDPWDAAHITTWNFLPSLLRHIGVAPLWAVHVLYGVWIAVAVGLVLSSWRMVGVLRAHAAQVKRPAVNAS